MGRIIAFASGKGGTGKSVCAACIGEALAMQGMKVLILDANPGLRGMEMILGVDEEVIYTFNDVLAGRMELTDACVPIPSFPGLDLLAAPQTKNPGDISADEFRKLLRLAAPAYDYVLVDCPSGLEQGARNAISAAEEMVLIVTPERLSVRAADRVRGMVESQGLREIRVIVNRVRPKWYNRHEQLLPEEIAELLGCSVVGCIPESGKLRLAADRGEAFLQKESDAKSAFQLAAAFLCGRGNQIWHPNKDDNSGKGKKKRK